jgi:hypothetical protein
MKFTCSKCAASVEPDWQFCSGCGKRLPMKTNQKLASTERQIEKARSADWERYQANRDIIKFVQILAPASACEQCRRDSEQAVSLDEPMPLPHECACDPWCKCTLIAVPK